MDWLDTFKVVAFYVIFENFDHREVLHQVTNNNQEASLYALMWQQDLELTIWSAADLICLSSSRANTLESKK